MKLPRDLSGDALVKALERIGYQATRQTGSHIRLTTQEHGEHHVVVHGTVPCVLERYRRFFEMSNNTFPLPGKN